MEQLLLFWLDHCWLNVYLMSPTSSSLFINTALSLSSLLSSFASILKFHINLWNHYPNLKKENKYYRD